MLNRQAVTSPAGIAQYLEKQKYGVQDCHLNWDTPLADLTEHSGQLQKLGQVFKKHVKPKKQHEIFRQVLILILLFLLLIQKQSLQ